MSESQFYLSESELDGFEGEYILCTQKWPQWNMTMEIGPGQNVSGVGSDPGKAGYFKFTKKGCSPTEYYLISTKRWPETYLFMDNDPQGNVKGWDGDPGPQGHWRVELQGSIVIDENGTQQLVPYFHLRPLQWTNWCMFVNGDYKGNVKGAKGSNPGAQANILFKKVQQ